MPISWNTVIFKFHLIFATDERRIVKGKAFHTVFCGSPLIRVSFVATDQWASPKHLMEALSRQNSSLIGRKIQAKFESDCISRSGHRCKITEPNVIILVSFFSAEDALSNGVKKYEIFCSQGTENPPFPFFFGTPGIDKMGVVSASFPIFSLLRNSKNYSEELCKMCYFGLQKDW